MGTPINQGGESRRPPGIALRNIGDYVDVAIVNEEKVPAYVFGTRDQAVTKSGKPKTQDLVTVIVIRGNGVVRDNNVDRPVVEGEVCSIYFEGQNRWDPDFDKARAKGDFKSWSGAKEDLGQLEVGDIMRWKYESDVQGQGAQPRRVRPVKLRHAKPEEAELTTRCEQLHREGTAVLIGAGNSSSYTDEEPFVDLVSRHTDFRNMAVTEPWL